MFLIMILVERASARDQVHAGCCLLRTLAGVRMGARRMAARRLKQSVIWRGPTTTDGRSAKLGPSAFLGLER
jgi:hypothetical protein